MLQPHSQKFIFLLTYEWAQQAIVLHYHTIESLFSDKLSNLSFSFVSLKENEALQK
jgi:hypothetical protein